MKKSTEKNDNGAAKKRASRRSMLRALRRDADLAELAHIRERLALPMIKRTNFLFVKLPNGGYAL